MLAFLGGTGPEGRGLALRLALAGEAAIIGSRDAGRAATAAEELLHLAPGAHIEGAANADAAAGADAVFLTFPYEGQRPVLEQLGQVLAGKIVVNVVAPMSFERGRGRTDIDAVKRPSTSPLVNPASSRALMTLSPWSCSSLLSGA